MSDPTRSADAALTERGAENLTELQGQTLQREIILRSLGVAKSGNVVGFISLDPQLDRSFSADPLKNLFGLDRKMYPTGHASFLPRRFMYLIPPIKEIRGKLGSPAMPWRMVIVGMEFPYPEVLPHTLAVPLSAGGSRQIAAKGGEVGSRQPDFFRAEIPLTKDDVRFLKEHNFQVLPADPAKLFEKAIEDPEVLEALQKYPVLPGTTFKNRTGLTLTSTDWNAPLSLKPGAEFEQHLLGGRNTNVAYTAGFVEEFGITLAPDAIMTSRYREILIPYKDMVTVAVLKQDAGEGAGLAKDFKYTELLRQSNPERSGVQQTSTRFSPRTYVTFEMTGRYDAKSRALLPVSDRLALPPGERTFSVIDAGSTKPRIVNANYRKQLAALVSGLEATHASWTKLLPEEITRVLRKL